MTTARYILIIIISITTLYSNYICNILHVCVFFSTARYERQSEEWREYGKRGLKTRVGDRKDTVREINGGNESSGKKQCSRRAHDEWKI